MPTGLPAELRYPGWESGFFLPLIWLAAVWALAVILFRVQQSGGWDWGSFEIPDDPAARRRMLVLISFSSLFFELLMIRWISVEIRIFAYFKNLALIACYLGFGAGVYLARRRVPMLFVPASLGILALMLRLPWPKKDALLRALPQLVSGFDDFELWATSIERSPWWGIRGVSMVLGVLLIALFFSLVALMFVPLGQAIGFILNGERSANLAYTFNVAASLAGIWAFTGVSALSLPPGLWFALALGTLLPVWRGNKPALATALALALAVIVAVQSGGEIVDTVIWSPYQKLRLSLGLVDEQRRAIGYTLQVNNTGYQSMIDCSRAFLAAHPGMTSGQPPRLMGYDLPLQFRPGARRVMIVGAGMGNDVAGALRNTEETGAEVTAVEIDPVIYDLGRRLHPERPYQSPRVRVVINDARNYFETTKDRFDLIIFGLLDAHTLGSPYTNVRLDNYVYTRESLARAASLLNPGGVMVLKFHVDRDFIGERMTAQLKDTFGKPPICFFLAPGWATGATFFVADRDHAATRAMDADPELAAVVAKRPFSFPTGHTITTTDDWPYLYHRARSIPNVYLLLSAVLLAITLAFLHAQGAIQTRIDRHFFFLGAAFLLLEVQVISRMAMFFGATWQVNSLVITTLLVMILLANLVARRISGAPRFAYPALIVSLVVTYVIPAERLLFGSRWLDGLMLATLFTLPVFFAGLIFISSFEATEHREEAFGSNLLGGVAGGLLECLSFVIGVRALLLVALAAYSASWFSRKSIAARL